MRAVEIAASGGPENLRLTDRPKPDLGPGDVLIEVAAAALNGADLAQRKGNYPPPAGASDLPGLEVAGTVVEVGGNVNEAAVGDRVCALLVGGGYAEYVAVPSGHVAKLPDGYDLIKGAALIEAIATVWANVFETAHLRSGESLLVHGGTSGIGTTAIQLARLHGCTVFATAGSSDKVAFCNRLGARGINYRSEDFAGIVRAETKGGVDVVLDIVGGPYLSSNLRSLAPDGRLAVIAFNGGRVGELDLARVMLNRLRISGSTLRARASAEKERLLGEIRKHVWPMVVDGRFVPVIDSVYPLAQASAAHAHMETSKHIGKIVLQVRGA